jgi:hypothetical protein
VEKPKGTRVVVQHVVPDDDGWLQLADYVVHAAAGDAVAGSSATLSRALEVRSGKKGHPLVVPLPVRCEVVLNSDQRKKLPGAIEALNKQEATHILIICCPPLSTLYAP